MRVIFNLMLQKAARGSAYDVAILLKSFTDKRYELERHKIELEATQEAVAMRNKMLGDKRAAEQKRLSNIDEKARDRQYGRARAAVVVDAALTDDEAEGVTVL